MMKKLLVLTLVLGIASLASAGIDLKTIAGLDYSVSGNTLSVTGTGVTGYLFNLAADNGSELSNAVVAPGFSTYNSAGLWYGDHWTGASASNTTPVAAGSVIFSIDFTPGTQMLNFIYSAAIGSNSSITVNNQDIDLLGYSMTVPEPMTMGLLGLGGLFLARRKK